MAHSKVYGFCDAKCKVEVVPKKGGTITGRITDTYAYPLLFTNNGVTAVKKSEPSFLRNSLLPTDDATLQMAVVPSDNEWYIANQFGFGTQKCELNADGTYKSGGDGTMYLSVRSAENKANAVMTLKALHDGQKYGTCPSWNLGVDDDSDKILTIKMANRLPSLVRTDANQNVGGDKHFLKFICQKNMDITSRAFIPSDYTREHGFYNLTGDGQVAGYMVTQIRTDGTRGVRIGGFGVGGHHNFIGLDIKSNGDAVGFAPPTPNNANGNEIATAGWVNNKLANQCKKIALETSLNENANAIYLNNIQTGDLVFLYFKLSEGTTHTCSFHIGDFDQCTVYSRSRIGAGSDTNSTYLYEYNGIYFTSNGSIPNRVAVTSTSIKFGNTATTNYNYGTISEASGYILRG